MHGQPPQAGVGDLGQGVPLRREMEWLHSYNAEVKRIANAEGCVCVDIHEHFMGHGRREPNPSERWYWPENIIEPGARGASEVRRLWLRALGVEI